MDKFFFFTGVDLLQTQLNEGTFGPVLSMESDFEADKETYRLTSFYSSTSDPLAYAICNGQILVQKHSSNTNLVNVLLKPDNQPSSGLPKINHFVYRGILKSSLTDQEENTLMKSQLLEVL